MRYPKLILSQMCTTPIIINLYCEDLNEDGEQVELPPVSTVCNYQGTSKRVMTDEKLEVQITATVYIRDDIFPNIPQLNGGTVEIFGEVKRIHSGAKMRNPDGTVNFIKLELI